MQKTITTIISPSVAMNLSHERNAPVPHRGSVRSDMKVSVLPGDNIRVRSQNSGKVPIDVSRINRALLEYKKATERGFKRAQPSSNISDNNEGVFDQKTVVTLKYELKI